MKKYIVYIATCLFTSLGFAQNPVYNVINTVNGFASNNVYDLLQDDNGFIWIGHDKGLSKYDGLHFKNYTAPTEKGLSLSNVFANNNTIWCQDFAGNIYYLKHDSLQREARLANNGSYIPAGVFNKNTVASVGNDSIRLINTNNNIFNSFFCTAKNISAVYYTNTEISYIDSKKLITYTNNHITSKEIYAPVQLYFIRKINNIYFGLNKSEYPYLYKIINDNTVPISILKKGLFIQSVNIIENEIWIGTTTGAYCFDFNWQPKYNGQCFFENTSITKIIKDREANYWFSTINKGIYLVPDINTKLFNHNNQGISTLALYNNQIIAGTFRHEIISFNNKNGTFTNIYKGATNHEILNIFTDNNEIIYGADRLVQLNPEKKVTEIEFSGKSITAINKSFLAVAQSDGVSLIRRNNSKAELPIWLTQKNTTWFNKKYNLINAQTRGRCVNFNNTDSTLYAGTTNGLFYFSPKGNGKITFEGKDIFPSQIKYNNKNVYVATYNNGLFIINEKKIVKKINHPALTNNIYKILIQDSTIWLMGTDLLQQYNILNNTVNTYNYNNGLPKAELKDLLAFNNEIFIATSEGLILWNYKTKNLNTKAPLLTINNVIVNNQSFSITKPFFLNANENNISIYYSLLSFKSNNSNSLIIQYKINEENWQNTNHTGVLSLPSLSSGTYKIEMRGFNENGIVTNNNPIINFNIATPFYKSIWFLLLIVLIILGTMFLIFKDRLKTEQQKNQLLSQKIQLENELQKSVLSSIKSQMNPHFLFNALNTIQSYIYTNDKESASQYLGKFSELTRLILDISNKENVSLAEEIKAIKLYLELEKLRFDDKLYYQIIIHPSLSIETSYISAMLIQPYIENAIKHGLLHKKNNWELLITFQQKNNGVEVVIDDNGIGRKRSEELNKNKFKKHQSFATSANEKRLQILNKGTEQHIFLEIIDKTDQYNNATGTTVRMFIPFSKHQAVIS